MKGANYAIVNDTDEVIVLRDLGPWDRYMTITNAAELVVAELHARNVLKPDKKILYYDSENEMDQLLHDGMGHFRGFAPGPTQPMKRVGPRMIEGGDQ